MAESTMTGERTLQTIHADDAENTLRDLFEQQLAIDILMYNLPREMKYEDRIESIALTWFGFVRNHCELRNSNKTLTRKKRTIHFLDQVYGAGKTRFCIELITQLNTRFEQIWQLVLERATLRGFKDKKDLDFMLDTLTQFKTAKYVGIPSPFAHKETVEAMYLSLLTDIAKKCMVDDKDITNVTPGTVLKAIAQAVPSHCIVLHLDELTHMPLRTSTLLYACARLEESAADYGIKLSIVLSGRGTRISLMNVNESPTARSWIMLEQLKRENVLAIVQDFISVLEHIKIEDINSFVEQLTIQTGGKPRMIEYVLVALSYLENALALRASQLSINNKAMKVFLLEIMPRLLSGAFEYHQKSSQLDERNVSDQVIKNLCLFFVLLALRDETFDMNAMINIDGVPKCYADILSMLPVYYQGSAQKASIVRSNYMFLLIAKHVCADDFRLNYLASAGNLFTNAAISKGELLEFLGAYSLRELSWCVGKTWKDILPFLADTDAANEEVVTLSVTEMNLFKLSAKCSTIKVSPVADLQHFLSTQPRNLLIHPREHSNSSDVYVNLTKTRLACSFKAGAQTLQPAVVQEEIDKCGAKLDESDITYVLCMMSSHLGPALKQFLPKSGFQTLNPGTYYIVCKYLVHFNNDEINPAGIIIEGCYYNLIKNAEAKDRTKKQDTISINFEEYYIRIDEKYRPTTSISTLDIKSSIRVPENVQVVFFNETHMQHFLGEQNYELAEKISSDQFEQKIEVLQKLVQNTVTNIPSDTSIMTHESKKKRKFEESEESPKKKTKLDESDSSDVRVLIESDALKTTENLEGREMFIVSKTWDIDRFLREVSTIIAREVIGTITVYGTPLTDRTIKMLKELDVLLVKIKKPA